MKVLQFPQKDENIKDPEEILPEEHWRLAEEAKNGNRYCMRGLAEIYESMWHRSQMPGDNHRDITAKPEKLFWLAFRWRLKAAEAGDRDSMRWMAVYMVKYQKDFNITDEDAGGHSALDWQIRAAEAGDKYAQKWMGDIYADPYYEKADQAVAQEWYRKSAMAGCIYAMHELAERFHYGTGCTQDEREALYWYRASGEKVEFWRDLSGTEIRMSLEDLAKAGQIGLKKEMNDEEIDWLRAHLDRALKLGEMIAIEPSLMRELRKLRMKMNVIR